MTSRKLYRLIALCLAVAVVTGGLAWTASTTGLAATRALRQGDRGDEVQALQTKLNEAGYPTGGVTGYFGSGTLKAVKALQTAMKLTADGIVGPATLTALDKAVQARTATSTASSGNATYTVKPGDALSLIAERYHVSQSALVTANHLRSADSIYAGQRLTIPGAGSAPASGSSGSAPATGGTPPPQPDTTNPSDAKPVLYQADRRLALTFDDGPDASVTPQILAVLAKHRALATFFVIGEKAEANKDLIKQLADAGHAVENHGYKHTDLTRATTAAARANVEQGAAAIKALTGQQPAFFRPPTGAFNTDLTGIVKETGARVLMWSNIGGTNLPADQLRQRLQTAAFDGAVLLLHDTDPAVPDVLDSLLTEWEKDGYRFVTVPQLFAN